MDNDWLDLDALAAERVTVEDPCATLYALLWRYVDAAVVAMEGHRRVIVIDESLYDEAAKAVGFDEMGG